MGRRKKIGDARSDASQSKSRQDGRIHSIVNSGTQPDERHSTTISPVELSVSAKRIARSNEVRTAALFSPLTSKTSPTQSSGELTRTMIYRFRVSAPYYSLARKEWRIECYEKWGQFFTEERQEYKSYDTHEEAQGAYESLKRVKDWREWEEVNRAIERRA
jgi:hypothetical protein